MPDNYYNAIIICKDNFAKKYHDINKFKLSVFELWAVAKFPDALHVNYYDKSGKFVVQHKLS
jgi:hypothetical protein